MKDKIIELTRTLKITGKTTVNGIEAYTAVAHNNDEIVISKVIAEASRVIVGVNNSEALGTRTALLKKFNEELAGMRGRTISITFYKKPNYIEVYKKAQKGEYSNAAFKEACEHGEIRTMTGVFITNANGYVRKHGNLQILEFGTKDVRPVNLNNIIEYTFNKKYTI